MNDLFYVAVTVAFFAIAFAYIRGCENLRGGAVDE